MAESRIPVDLFNPGQVFACLGFLEAADVLLGDAEGGFDWSDETDVRFVLRAAGLENPVARVLDFIRHAKVEREVLEKLDEEIGVTDVHVDTFPAPAAPSTILKVRLSKSPFCVTLGHWADDPKRLRDDFKLHAGQQQAAKIFWQMLEAWRGSPAVSTSNLFGTVSLGGTFGFDARREWTGIDVGFSPDAQAKYSPFGVAASPLVELMAVWGLEHTRPAAVAENRCYRYSAWQVLLRPALARCALSSALGTVLETRSFRFQLAGDYYKSTTISEEITSP